jgi:hypothetical protein
MVGTGRPQFADRIFAELREDDDGGHERELRRDKRFHPDVLGANWKSAAATLPRERIRMLVHDLAYFGGDQGLEMAIELAARDTETDHLGFVLDEIHYRGKSNMAEQLLAAMDEASILRWIDDGRFQEIAARFAPPRFRSGLEAIIQSNETGAKVLRARMSLAGLNGEALSEDIVSEGLAIDRIERENRNWFLGRFAELAPETLSCVLMAQVRRGEPLFGVERYLRNVDEVAAASILDFLLDDTRDIYRNPELAKHLTIGKLRQVLRELLLIRTEMNATPRREKANCGTALGAFRPFWNMQTLIAWSGY